MLVTYFDSARRMRGLTQHDVAKKVGISAKTLISYEQGKSSPSLRVARKISKLYGIPLDSLLQPGDEVPDTE